MTDDDEPKEHPQSEQLSLDGAWLPAAEAEHPTSEAPGQPAQGETAADAGETEATRRNGPRRTILAVALAVLLAAGLALGLGLGLSSSGNTPQAVVQDFVNDLLTARYTEACKDVQPSGQSQCGLLFVVVGGLPKGHPLFTGRAVVAGGVVRGSQALVAISGKVCGFGVGATGQSGCASVGNPSSQLPAGSAAFARMWAQVNNADSNSFGPIPCVEIGGKWYVYLAPSGLGGTTPPPATIAQDDVAAEANLQTGLTGAKTYYTENDQTYAGLTPRAFAALDTGLTVVTGATPSSGPSVVSLLAGAGGTYAVLAAWVPFTQTCWAIMDSAAANSLDGQQAFVGTLYIKSLGGPQSACKATTYSVSELPADSGSSTDSFEAAG